ncbi:exonuclease domain-containing protein [Thalassolituus marinus]
MTNEGGNVEETCKDKMEVARAEAIEKNQCFSKGRLRNEFRMKPKPEADPVALYKNGYGREFGVYRISDCVPMKARNTKPPSEKQMRARAILAIKAKLKSNEAIASSRAVHWLSENPLFLDTETTGLGDKAQILELAISDAQGTILFETRVRPTVPIDPEAEGVHGITAESLANSPTWPEVSAHVRKILCGVLGILPPNTAKTAEAPVFTGLQATINFNLAQVSVSSSAFGSKNEQKQATIDSHCR